MRPSRSLLSQVERLALRQKSTSFIGLGRMGFEMAHNLFSKQFTLFNDARFVICDAVPKTAEDFARKFSSLYPAANIDISKNPEEAVLASHTIITMLPSSPQVKSVYGEGVIPALRSLSPELAKSTLCIDSTTLDVDVARNISREVHAAGAQMVDAPVSGGVAGAKAATLSFLVGGTEASYQLAHPILSMMGSRIIHCGPAGAGLGAKICNNLVLGVEQIVVAEAMLLGQNLGLDPAVLTQVISSSTGSCWSISVNNPVPKTLPGKSPPCERDYEGGFATALMLKDMGLATNIAEKASSPLPLGKVAESLYAKAIKEEPQLAKKDFSSIYRFLQLRTE